MKITQQEDKRLTIAVVRKSHEWYTKNSHDPLGKAHPEKMKIPHVRLVKVKQPMPAWE